MIRGVDLSHHNDFVDFKKIKAAGFHFVILKATEGVTNTDPTFQKRWKAAKVAGLFRGAYHFYRPQADIKKQIEHFLDVVGVLESSDMPHTFDWEKVPESSSVGRLSQIADARLWLSKVEKESGKTPIIYTGPSFMGDDMRPPQEFSRFALDIAHYGVKKPRIPKPWLKWTFWQDMEDGKIPGAVTGDVDMEWFNGTLNEFLSFVGSIKEK